MNERVTFCCVLHNSFVNRLNNERFPWLENMLELVDHVF